MKKIIIMIMLYMGFSTWAYGDITKTVQYQATVGVPFKIDPIVDIGYKHGHLVGMSGMLQLYYDDRSYSPSDFTYTTTVYKTGTDTGQVYTITPQKTGTSMFHVKVNLKEYSVNNNGGYYAYYTYDIQYTIYIVDVTKINIPTSLSLKVGESYTFSPIIEHNLAKATLTWQSENPSIATVNSKGVITTVGIGTTTITCTAQNGVSAKCELTVKSKPAESIALDVKEKQMYKGAEYQLTASILPEAGTSKILLWETDNKDVAIVNDKGKVTAIGTGTCNITATTQDGTDLSASCKVSVISDYLYTDDVKAVIGSNFLLPIYMNNVIDITTIQFDLYLPDGITLAKDEYSDDIINLSNRSGYEQHSIATRETDDGALRVIVSSQNNSIFKGNSGELLILELIPKSTMLAGKYNIAIKNIVLSDPNAKRYTAPDETRVVTVSDFTLGDVNNDGYIDVSDLAGVVRFILEDAESSLIFKAADMDGNGIVEIPDYSVLVNVILNQSNVTPKEGVFIKEKKTSSRMDNVISLIANDKGEIMVNLNEDRQFTGMQFDLMLPEGVTLAEDDVECESRKHNCWSIQREDGSYRILCSSLTNAMLKEGTILSLKTNDKVNGVATISNVVLSDINSTRHKVASAQVSLDDATGIHSIDNEKCTIDNEVYNLAGQRVQKMQKGIYIVNGKKVMNK